MHYFGKDAQLGTDIKFRQAKWDNKNEIPTKLLKEPSQRHLCQLYDKLKWINDLKIARGVNLFQDTISSGNLNAKEIIFGANKDEGLSVLEGISRIMKRSFWF